VSKAQALWADPQLLHLPASWTYAIDDALTVSLLFPLAKSIHLSLGDLCLLLPHPHPAPL